MVLLANPIGTFTTATLTAAATTAAVRLEGAAGFSIQASITVDSPVTGCSIKLQASLDGITFTDIDNSSSTITATTTVMYNYTAPFFEYFRVSYAISSGQITAATKYSVKALR